MGPNYNRPPVETPPAWKEQPPEGWKTATPSDTIAKGNWWEVFGDPQLNALETQAIAANQNLKAAAQRVIEARASAAVTRSNLFPFVGAAPSIGGGGRPGLVQARRVPGCRITASTFSLPLWPATRWTSGARFAARIESANALTQASVANYENVLLTLKSDVASFYIMVHYIDQERQVLRDNIDLQQKAWTWRRCATTVASPAGWTSPKRPPCWTRRKQLRRPGCAAGAI